ncbi:hypothetical protein E5S68_01190 [Streptococcus rubneri]|uniref:Uncharacterized protein n=1 Tax=Streptococcus rubneri TaxID=1234680 RepID=A0A4Z1DZB6_9STRE|nr:hypothetical protein E5S68_01190 [Streptococcus rubneri]
MLTTIYNNFVHTRYYSISFSHDYYHTINSLKKKLKVSIEEMSTEFINTNKKATSQVSQTDTDE